MKKLYRTLMALCAGILCIGLGISQGLAAGGDNKVKPSVPNDGLHRDGSAFVKESRMTQADREAAADRAKAKGFGLQKTNDAPGTGNVTPANREAEK